MQACIIHGKRTAFGNFLGALSQVHPRDLAVHSGQAALEAAGVSADKIDAIYIGNVIPVDSSCIYLARHIGLELGIPQSVPALTLNRLCGSGLESVIQAARAIQTGESRFCLSGGVESMSQAPHSVDRLRSGQKLGAPLVHDWLLEGLTDQHVGLAMGETAENLANAYSISRSDQDAFAALSQRRAAEARSNGRLALEIAPLEIQQRKKTSHIAEDEFIKPESTQESLAGLKPAFARDGSVTAGNASGINDGASSLIVANHEAALQAGLKPLAMIRGWGITGCDPRQMGLGPVPAIPAALQMAGLKQADINLFEVNEAFAAQFLAVQRKLNLPLDKTNVNGGAIAIGHPLGASGNRITLSLALELQQQGLRYGVASLCIGGGQGIAIVLENTNV